MSNIIQTTTKFAMHIADAYIRPGCTLVDATCGNGHDTLNLAASGPSMLYAFDILPEAVASAEKLLVKSGFGPDISSGRIRFICDSHENAGQYIDRPVDVVMFNLGYLPGGGRERHTMTDSTLSACRAFLRLLADDGLICMTMYSGHEEGLAEKEALLSMTSQLDPRLYHVSYISMINQRNAPPEILLITKKRRKR